MITVENHIGKISVSENYLTEIVRHAVCDCFGVADVCNTNTFRSAVSSLTGGKLFRRKGVIIHADDGGITIDLHIKVSYGTNIKVAVNSIIHKVSFTVEEAVGMHVKNVNVFVDDMNA
ncbi:MAG: Asp23/Gls24 family envelope stress response protein [Ruminococcus sp.]|nr:Asp23/Gls24 family envelope stress response protein [Ruminococcus sp.]MDE6848660.1 Asp23/Gls24 family envelope stress response protein [Ruminococcus sp.]MDE7137703.1 Asp23/Gls24 family envelope stress response protein [Ruminococcus sp.]